MKSHNDKKADEKIRQPWEPMKLSFVGEASDVIHHGLGKSQAAHDQGDIFKPPGQG